MSKAGGRAALFEISFGDAGSAAQHQREGWAPPEHGFTWSIGPTSGLSLPILSPLYDWLITIHGEPLRGVGPEGRRLRIEFNGVEVGRFWTDRTFAKTVRVSGSLIGRQANVLTFQHPDTRRPSDLGGSDKRELAIRWFSLSVRPVTKLTPTPELVLPLPRGKDLASMLDRLYGDRAPKQLRGAFAEEQNDQPGASMAYYIFNRIRFFDYVGVSKLVQLWTGHDAISVYPTHMFSDDGTLIVCGIGDLAGPEARKLYFELPKSWEGRLETDSGVRMLIWHWLSVIPLLVTYARSGRSCGKFVLNLGDEAHARGISFCGQTSESIFIPDPYFLGSAAYQDLRTLFAGEVRPFAERLPCALWRGSSTGYRAASGVLGLPRVQLCMLAKEPQNAAWLDAGLTSFAQMESAAESDLVRDLKLERPFVSPTEYDAWKFHVDIDGNTSSWPGLFQKLLSGSVVLKVTSPQGWRQWYYDRLEPGVNFMPIESDLSDLMAKIKFLSYNQGFAAQIGQNGRQLALSMSYEAESNSALQWIEDAIVEETLRS